MKVIQILHHSLSPFNMDVDVRFYEGDFHVRVAKQILKQTTNYEIECWRPETTFKEVYTRKKDGITYKVFPSFYLKFGREYSVPLLRELRKESKNEEVLIHLHGIHNHFAYLVAYLFRDLPIVGQHRGGRSPLALFKNSKHPLRFLFLYDYPFMKVAFRNIDYFFAQTKEEEAFLCNTIKAKNIKILTSGVDFDKFRSLNKEAMREKFNLDIGRRYILYVGRLDKGKGLNYLFKAFLKVIKKYPDTILSLAGEGEYRSDLETLAKDLGILNNVIFLGYVENNQLPFLYNAADLFILPSLSEGVPVSCIEAMACETPVIGTSVGGISDLMNNFKSGLLIPPKDTQAITDAIFTVFENPNPFKFDRKSGERYYSWNNIIKNTINVYDALFDIYYNYKWKYI